MSMTTKNTLCQLPTTGFQWQPYTCNRLSLRLLSSLKLRQTKYTTGDSCDGGISVLNDCLLTLTDTTLDIGLTHT